MQEKREGSLEKKKTAKTAEESNISFEESLKELEAIAQKLERGDLGLEESIHAFERGISLAKYCHDMLELAERKISLLQKGESEEVVKKAVKVKETTGEIEDDHEMQGSLL